MKNESLKAIAFFAILVFCSLSLVSSGQDIQPYKAQEVKPYKAEEVKPYKAEEIKPYKAEEVKPVRTRETRPARVKRVNPYQPAVNPVTPPEKKQEQPVKVEVPADLFGLYQYWVPGASYTTPDYTNNQLVIHTSAGTGVLPGGIKINIDGTYVWNSSWDGKIIKGNWRATGDGGYPIELLNAQEGKNWKIGKTTGDPSTITIWDGSTWYNGEKIKK
jgi:hypothetical protein